MIHFEMEFITLKIITCIVLVFIVRFSLKSRSPNPAIKACNIGILIVFSLFGWKNYMPFFELPSIMELIQRS